MLPSVRSVHPKKNKGFSDLDIFKKLRRIWYVNTSAIYINTPASKSFAEEWTRLYNRQHRKSNISHSNTFIR